MKVIIISITRLRNNEYYRFLMEIVSLVSDAISGKESESKINDSLNVLLDKLKELLKRLDVAVISLNKSELTEPVIAADNNRGEIYRGFVLHVMAFSHSLDEKKVEACRRIQVLIDNYGDFRRRPMNEESAIMDNFLQDLNSMHRKNIELIGASEWMDSMQKTNEAFKSIMDERHNERMAQLREEVRTLRVQTDELYRQIISLLEIGYTLEKGIYSDIIKKVNERISYYKTTLATRQGRSDAKKENEIENEIEELLPENNNE